jgi:hypothetical protein
VTGAAAASPADRPAGGPLAEKRAPGPSLEETAPPDETGRDDSHEDMAPWHDLEDIAAFLDGKLPAERRAGLIEHLASCESCYEVFAGAARFQEDNRSQESPLALPNRPFERRLGPRAAWSGAWRGTAAAIAAVLVATVGVLLLIRWRGSSGDLSTTRLAAALEGRAAVLADVPWPGHVKRGPADTAEVPSEILSFRLGVSLLDLRLGLAGTDRERALEALRRLDAVLEGIDLLPPETREASQRLRAALRAGAAPRSLLATAKAQEKKALEGVVDPPLVELGGWTEACRLGGRAGQTELFHDRATRRLLERFLEPGTEAAKDLDPRAAKALAGIQAAIAGGHPGPGDLAGRCEALLDQLDPD